MGTQAAVRQRGDVLHWLLADGPQTFIYGADGGTHVINVLRRSDFEVVNEFGGPGVGIGSLGRPHNLTVDPSGNIYVGEAAGPEGEGDSRTGEMVPTGYRAQKFRCRRRALMPELTRLLRGVGFGAAAALLALLIGLGGLVRTAEMKLYDGGCGPHGLA